MGKATSIAISWRNVCAMLAALNGYLYKVSGKGGVFDLLKLATHVAVVMTMTTTTTTQLDTNSGIE